MEKPNPPLSIGFERLWILGFAGHRELPDPAAITQSIRTAIRNFRQQVDGEAMGRASAASGADLLFLEACRDAGIAYSVVLPFPEERFCEDFPSPAEWKRAQRLIRAAASVEIAPGHEGVPEAYHLTAREILDVADAMLFVWDGEPARGIGGTGETVADARDRRVPHRIIQAADGKLHPFETHREFPWGEPKFDRIPGGDDLAAIFETLDLRAQQAAPRSRLLSACSITLNQLATLVSAILVALAINADAAPVVKFVIICAATFLPWIGARRHTRTRWMESRLHSELLRSILASHSFTPVLRPFAAEFFQSEAVFLRSASWKIAPRRLPWNEEVSRYIEQRLDGQIGYLRAKGTISARRLGSLRTIFRISSSGALILGAAAIFYTVFDGSIHKWFDAVFLRLLPSALPAVAAWSLSMIALFEYKRRSGLYLQLADRLELKRAELRGARCQVTAAATVASCERLLLAELWEWYDINEGRR